MTTYLLLAGINKYDRTYYGDADLGQCVNDANRLMVHLDNTLKGTTKNLLLLDKDATAAQYIQQVKSIARQAKRYDVVVLFQSSHGTYYDAPSGRLTGRCMHDRILWDYEVLQLLSNFKAGVTVVWVTDACYSESTERAPMAPQLMFEGVRAKALPMARIPGAKGTPVPTVGNLQLLKANLIAISACTADEVAYEDERGGVFTNALMASHLASRPKTYASVIQMARNTALINYPQHVVVTCTNVTKRFLARPVFTGVKKVSVVGTTVSTPAASSPVTT